MERIASFQVDHKKLNRGIYVSSLLESKMITDDMKKRILKNIEDTEVYMRNIIDGNQIFN